MSRDNGAVTLAEQLLDEQLGLTRPRAQRDEDIAATPFDIRADDHDPQREIRSSYLTRRLIESPDAGGWRLFWRNRAQPPVIRIQDAFITGCLDLRGADLPYVLEFVRCRFEQAPDLRQATLASGLLMICRFPGLRARNLSTANDLGLLNCVSTGPVNLTDAQIGGSLTLNDSELRHPHGRALHADRLSVAGALLGSRLQAAGELRIPGAKVGGNVNFSGASLRNRGRYALNATGVQIVGSLRCDVEPHRNSQFTAAGTLFLPSARIAGDLRLRNAVLEPGAVTQRTDSPYDDPICALIADRGEIRGDVQLDRGFRSGGTIRLISAKIGGDLRLAQARIEVSWLNSGPSPRSLHLDGADISGNLDAGGVVLDGPLRMVDVHVRGGFSLNRARLDGQGNDVMQANRIVVGSNLDCREAEIAGSLRLQNAQVAGNVDLRASSLSTPGRFDRSNAPKPGLDLRAARIGRDLVCAAGVRPFASEGEVQLRRASIGRQANFRGCVLGGDSYGSALNGFGLAAQELALQPAQPPRGRILLRQAQCELLGDNATLWQATAGVDVDNFCYDDLTDSIEPTDSARVRQRLAWLRTASQGQFQPGPYDQLATLFRNNGNEDHAGIVLIEKQRRRYRAIAAASRPPFRLPVLLWSWLQWVTVSYGYRPLRALLWLIFFAAAGTAWFAAHPLVPVDSQDRPAWNPCLYTVDQLIPIINFGNKDIWRADGASGWISALLIVVGWLLATTVAAGVTRTLRRER